MEKKMNYLTIDDAIAAYQRAREDNDEVSLQVAYNNIIKFYNPNSFKNVWWKKYGWLYDFDKDDFNADYYAKFIECLNKFSSETKAGKKMTLNNYFYSAAERMYGIIIKSINTAKRNPSQICPMCSKETANISSHIRECHKDIVWNGIVDLGFDEKSFVAGCPFCPKHLKVKKCATDIKEQIIQHVAKVHSTILFDSFKDIYPEFYLGNNHVRSITEFNYKDDEYYDIIEQSSSLEDSECHMISDVDKSISLEHFINTNKTELEDQIVEFILDAKVRSISGGIMNHRRLNAWRVKQHLESGGDPNDLPEKIDKKTFSEAIRKLQDKMITSGMVER